MFLLGGVVFVLVLVVVLDGELRGLQADAGLAGDSEETRETRVGSLGPLRATAGDGASPD